MMENIDLKDAVSGRRVQSYVQSTKGSADKIAAIVKGNDAVTLDLADDRTVGIVDRRQLLRESSRAGLIA
jgi:hypothetical protein